MTSGASASARSDFADSGQPILLNSGTAAGGQAVATPAQAGQAPSQKTAAIPLSPAAAGPAPRTTQPAPRLATAVAQPAPAEAISLVPAESAPAATETPDLGLTPAPAETAATAPAAETPATEVLSDAPAAGKPISADAKAKLIGELEALKKRPGVAPAETGSADASAGNATAAVDCAEGSLDPQCAATE